MADDTRSVVPENRSNGQKSLTQRTAQASDENKLSSSIGLTIALLVLQPLMHAIPTHVLLDDILLSNEGRFR